MSRRKAPDQRRGAQSAAPPPALRAPSAAIATPAPPLKLDKIAAAVWVAVFEAGGGAYVPATDSWIIERYAQLQSRRAALQALVDGQGWTVAGSQDQLVQHPAARLLYQTEQMLLPLEDRLGLNPEARMRLGLVAAAGSRTALDRFNDTDEGDEFD